MLFLNDGNDMPQLGVSAFRTDRNEDTVSYVASHVGNGVRHYVITELFGNGHIVVEGLFSGEMKRKDIFVTLKIWPKDRKPRDLISSCKNTLEFVGLKYADLILVHAPIEVGNRLEQWKALEELVDDGTAKSLGITNITALQLADLLKSVNIPPAVFEVRSLVIFLEYPSHFFLSMI